MFKGARVILTVLSFLYIASAQTKTSVAPTNAQNAASASDSSARLPIKRVVLYKNGVGYFEHSARAHYELTDLEDQQVNQINALIAENHVTPALQKALRAILDQKNLVDGYDGQIKSRQGAVDSITKDQARLRENMKALKGTPEEKALLQRYTKQLDSQEDQLASLQKEIADLNAKRDKANEDLDQMVQNTVLDESF